MDTEAKRAGRVKDMLYYKGQEYDALYNAADGYIDLDTGEILADGADAIIEQIEAIHGDASEKALTAASLYLELESEVDRKKAFKQKLDRDIKACEARAEAVKKALNTFCDKAHVYSATDGIIKISHRATQSVDVYDEDLLPDEYMRIKKEPDKIALRDAMKAGKQIEGARIAENWNLQIKV